MPSVRRVGATVALLLACACGKEDEANGGGHPHGGTGGTSTAGEGGLPDDGGQGGDAGSGGRAGNGGAVATGGTSGAAAGGTGAMGGVSGGGGEGGEGTAGEAATGGEGGGGGETGGEGGVGAEGGTAGAGSGGAPGGSAGVAGGGQAGSSGAGGAGFSGSGGSGQAGTASGAGGGTGGSSGNGGAVGTGGTAAGNGGAAGGGGAGGMAGSGGFSDIPVTGDPLRPRHGHTATLDDESSLVYVLGGEGYHELYADLLAFDVRSNVLTRLSTQGQAPSPRLNHVAVFDAVRRRLVVFGGRGHYDLFADVYALDVDTLPLTWTRLSPTGAPPSPRAGHVAVFDAVRNRMVVFGGQTYYDLEGDTWELSFVSSANGTWRALSSAGTPPVPRTEAAIAFDSDTSRAFVGGGRGFHDVILDVSVLDLTSADGTWSSASPAPPTGVAGAWIWDATANRLFQESGQAYYGLLGGGGVRPVTDAALVYVASEQAALLIAGQGYYELSGRISRLDF